MGKEKQEFSMSNSVSVAAGVLWYPFSETGKPTNKDIEENFPLKSCVFENKSGEEYLLVLDPVAGNSGKNWTVPNGTTLSLDSEENINFHQLVVKNMGVLESAINELKIQVRTY